MNVAYKTTNCLSNIPKRDGKVAHPKATVAHPKATVGRPHQDRVNQAVTFGIMRYSKTIEELAKV